MELLDSNGNIYQTVDLDDLLSSNSGSTEGKHAFDSHQDFGSLLDNALKDIHDGGSDVAADAAVAVDVFATASDAPASDAAVPPDATGVI